LSVSFSETVPVSAAAKPCASRRCGAAVRGAAPQAQPGPRGRLGAMVEQYDVDELAAAFGLDAQQAQALARHAYAILAWPGNITSLRRREEVVSTLLGDSLALLDVPALPSEGRWLDLGSGAGVPGLPLAVALPGVHITLLDSASRKCAFLHEALAAVGLEQRGRVVCARSEQHAAPGAPGREAYDVVLARAVAPLPVLVELAAPLLAHGGLLLAAKTAAALPGEAEAAHAPATRCGLAAASTAPLPRSPLAGAVCAVYRKVAPCPSGVPRRPGMAAKRPLS
jgi:16S rRNA (guanine527-N7)-methyltransferase